MVMMMSPTVNILLSIISAFLMILAFDIFIKGIIWTLLIGHVLGGPSLPVGVLMLVVIFI